MLKISSNHKHVAVNRHNLTATNKTMTMAVRIVPAGKDLFSAVLFLVLASDGAFGLELIRESALQKARWQRKSQSNFIERLVLRASIHCIRFYPANV